MRAPDFWDRKTDGILPTLLRPLGCIVAGFAVMRQKRVHPYRAAVPVLCIGNLVAGGAGKTPVALDLVARLKARGVNAHVLLRGYGGSELGPVQVDPQIHTSAQVGDEALLLAQVAPTWVSRDRVQGAQHAVDAGAQALVLDDGFQNPSLHKDLSVLVVDGCYGFGNGRVMPAGPLRETVESGLKRADALVLMGPDEADVWGIVKRAGFKALTILRARLEPTPDAHDLAGRKVYAFAGIGRPQKFFDTLTDLGCKLVGCKSFDDHHPYTHAEVDALLHDAGNATVVTTAKDHVRLNSAHRDKVRPVAVSLAWKDAPAVEALVDRLLNTQRDDANG
ncbi:MAG TPA: tetraacyldisaccharide 4'-kinase [Magnetovibrio sp.]